MDAGTTLLVLLLVYLSAMVALVQYKGDTSIGNFTWGGGVMLVSLYIFVVRLLQGSVTLRQSIVTTMIVIWASRLIVHVYRRYKGTDPRFATWKNHGFKAFVYNVVWIFGQSVMIAIMSIPIIVINMSNPPGFTMLDFLGIAVWLTGYIYQAISDQQLFVFMQNPANKGHVMRSGLWHYCRHPNYFGEALMWWGLYVVALSTPFGSVAILTPLIITFLLRFVTGVPLLEHAMRNNAEYQAYKKTTNAFIPWFAKSH